MIKTEILNVNGKLVQGVAINAPGGEGHPNMLVMVLPKGYIMCGYLNLAAASGFGDACCIISGATFENLLENPVKAVSPDGENLGIKVGMTGAEVCEILG